MISWTVLRAGRPSATPRILIVSRLFPPETGAAAFRLGALARELVRSGVTVDVVTTRPPRPLVPSDPKGLRVRRWPVLRDRGGNVRGYLQFASFDIPLAVRLLGHRRPEVVVVEPPPTTGSVVRILCALRRIPYVYYAGDVSSRAAAGIGVRPVLVRVLAKVEQFAVGGAVAVLAVSQGVADDLRGLAGRPLPIEVVGTGVDTDVFTPPVGPTTAELDGAPGESAAARKRAAPSLLVYAGTMSELHGARIFVEAFAEVCEEFPLARMVFFGQGVEEPRIRLLAGQTAPGRVEFPGVVPGEVVATALAGANAGLASIHPDVGYDYAYPTKMFAATACGAPVIYAGPGPGRGDVVRNRLGWAVDWDRDAVAAAFREALGSAPSAQERARLVEWTRKNASQRSVGRRAAQIVLAHVVSR